MEASSHIEGSAGSADGGSVRGEEADTDQDVVGFGAALEVTVLAALPYALSLVSWAKEHMAGVEIYGALFDGRGERVSGDEEISIDCVSPPDLYGRVSRVLCNEMGFTKTREATFADDERIVAFFTHPDIALVELPGGGIYRNRCSHEHVRSSA